MKSRIISARISFVRNVERNGHTLRNQYILSKCGKFCRYRKRCAYISELVRVWNGRTFPTGMCVCIHVHFMKMWLNTWPSRQFHKITPELLNCAVRGRLFCGRKFPVSCKTVCLDIFFGHASGTVTVFFGCWLCLTVETPHYLWRYMIIPFHGACVRCPIYTFCNIVKWPAIASFLLEIGTRLESNFSGFCVWYRALTVQKYSIIDRKSKYTSP